MVFELVLTRVFSVIFWYHFSFLALSVTMLGLTVGSSFVYLFPAFFGLGQPEGGSRLTLERAAQAALGFATSAMLSYPLQLQLTQAFGSGAGALWQTLCFLLVLLIPFAISGIGIALLLTYRLRSAGWLYAVDLTGAALGCLLVPMFLQFLNPSQVMLVATLFPLLACICIQPPSTGRWVASVALLLVALLGAAGGGMPLKVIKGQPSPPYIFDLWNSYSRVTVEDRPAVPLWLANYQGPPIESKNITIDGGAGTDVLASDGDPTRLSYLATDITSAVYHLKKNAEVLVIGCGGGRDVATALHFGNQPVSTIEMNSNILWLLQGPLKAYSGNLLDKVTVYHDEARSFLEQHQGKYDIIQMSLIDTSAAVASGAYLLSEHSLYTHEAWTSILRHLRPDGVFSVTRNLYPGWPLEVHRCLTLAKVSLANLGVEDPRSHIILFEGRLREHNSPDAATGMVTLLVSPTPFSPEMLERARQTEVVLQIRERDFQRGNIGKFEALILNPATYAQALLEAPVDISPPGDNRPFFFFHLKLENILAGIGKGDYTALFYHKSMALLLQLLFWVSLLLLILVFLPLAVRRRPPPRQHILYFAGLGLGFMLVEVGLMQMLSLYLGHPLYSLVVVLALLLVASGLGSYLSRLAWIQRRPLWMFFGLILLVSLIALTQSFWTQLSGSLAWRVAVSACVLIPVGILMGMPCPLGFSLLSQNEAEAAWCWGINGAAGVLASVLAIMIALLSGLQAVLWAGVLAYGLSGLALWMWRKGRV